MDFEEWFKKRHTKTGLYEKSLFGDDDSLYLKHEMEKAFKAGQQSKQAEIRKAVLSLRNEFNLWADDTEPFHAIEAQIEQIEELLK